jgi:hypothetical protein
MKNESLLWIVFILISNMADFKRLDDVIVDVHFVLNQLNNGVRSVFVVIY